MQPMASTSAPTLPRLTEPNLHNHTRIEGIAPRRTVQIYLQSIKQAHGYFEVPSPPLDESNSPPARFVDRPLNLHPRSNEPESKRRRLEEEDEGMRDTALVIHRSAVGKKEKIENIRKETAPLKKKPSLVSAMRPRLTSLPNNSSSPLQIHRKEKDRGKEKKREVETASFVDELLDFEEGEEENDRNGDKGKSASRRKGKAKATETKKDKIEKGKGKGKLRNEPETEKEAEELEDRLEARKERRRNKAFIRKDRSQSAAATGAAAASKVTITKKKKREHRDEGSESEESEGRGGKGKKKGRKTAEQDGREQIQGLSRPSAVGKGRLTVKPPTRLGIFNKGKASSRTRVGHAVPDLAFSEMTFLDTTRKGAEASSSSLLTAESDLLDPRTLGKSAKVSTGRKTYGSKQKPRRPSSTNVRIDSDSSASSHHKDTLALAPRTSRSKRQNTPPARQATPKKPRRISSRTAQAPRSPTPSPVHHAPRSPQSQSGAIGQQPSPAQPPQEALESAVHDDSAFSAHSAHSLAIRRQTERDRNAAAARQIFREPIVEEEVVRDLSINSIDQAVNNPRYSPVPASIPEVPTLFDVTPTVDHQLEPLDRSVSNPSLNTASMERLAFDNLSVVEAQPTLPLGTTYSKTGSLPVYDHPRIEFVSQLNSNRSRSSSAAPTYRAPGSIISRQRSLSESAVSYIFNSPNPFSPSNFVNQKQSSNGSALSAPPAWRSMEGEELNREESEEEMDVELQAEFQLAAEEEDVGGEGDEEVDEGRFLPRLSRFGIGRTDDFTYRMEGRGERMGLVWPSNKL
ncbi:hypothetical protein JCM5353_004627 [Sporobolomyces roseus]